MSKEAIPLSPAIMELRRVRDAHLAEVRNQVPLSKSAVPRVDDVRDPEPVDPYTQDSELDELVLGEGEIIGFRPKRDTGEPEPLSLGGIVRSANLKMSQQGVDHPEEVERDVY